LEEVIRRQIEEGFEVIGAVDDEICGIVARNWPHLLSKLPPEEGWRGFRFGQNSSPVADELLGREVPFIVVTGYSGHKGDPPVLKGAQRVSKPVNFDELADRMTEVFVRRPAES
jgi:hypothetical protein